MRVPGAAWVALIAIITPWLTQYFGNTTWVEAAVIALGGIAALIKAYFPGESAPATARGLEDSTANHPFVTFLFGR